MIVRAVREIQSVVDLLQIDSSDPKAVEAAPAGPITASHCQFRSREDASLAAILPLGSKNTAPLW